MAKNNEIHKYDPHITTWLYEDSDEVLYVKSKLRFRPAEKKTDYSEEANRIKETFNYQVERMVRTSKSLDDRFLCGIDFSDGSLSVKKWSRAKFDIYVKPKQFKWKSVKELMKISQKINVILTKTFLREGFILMERETSA